MELETLENLDNNASEDNTDNMDHEDIYGDMYDYDLGTEIEKVRNISIASTKYIIFFSSLETFVYLTTF